MVTKVPTLQGQVVNANNPVRRERTRDSVTVEELQTAPHSIVRNLDREVPLESLLPAACELKLTAHLPVSQLGLSVRALNCLGVMEIENAGQLAMLTIGDLMAVRNMGTLSVWNVIRRLHDAHFPDQHDDRTLRREEADIELINVEPLLTEFHTIVRTLDWEVPIQSLLPTASGHELPTFLPISQLGLSVRELNCLGTLHIENAGQLARLTIGDLMAVRNMGTLSVWNIVRRLHVAHFRNQEFRAEFSCTTNADDWALFGGSDALKTVLFSGRVVTMSKDVSIKRLSLPDRIIHRLAEHGIATVARLLDVTMSELATIHDGQDWNVFELLEMLRGYCSCSGDVLVLTDIRLEDLPDGFDSILFDFAVSVASRRERKALCLMSVVDLGGLINACVTNMDVLGKLGNRIDPFLKIARDISRQESIDSEALTQLFSRLVDANGWSVDLPTLPLHMPLIRRIASILSPHPTLPTVYYYRLCGCTLNEVGQMTGVTKERARQQILQAQELLVKYPGFVSWALDLIDKGVKAHGGCLSCTDLETILVGEGVRRRQTVILKCLSGLPEWSRTSLTVCDDFVTLPEHWNHVSAIIRRIGLSVAQNAADERPGANLWSAPIKVALADTERVVNDDLHGGYDQVSLTQPAYERAVKELHGLYRVEGDRVYSRAYWALRFGSSLQKVEAILQASGRQMHHNEVREAFSKWSTTTTRIDGSLDRSPVALLWGCGTYIHRDFICVPYALIERVALWIKHKLSTGLPVVSVAGAYDTFKMECAEAGVPGRQALYSCLKLTNSAVLQFSQYPYVGRADDAGSRTSLNLLIDEFVRSEGGFVSRQEILRYVSSDLGVDSRLVPLYTNLAPNLLSGTRKVIHADNFQLDETVVSGLVGASIQLATEKKQIAISEVFKAKPDLHARLEVEDARLVHSLVIYKSKGSLIGRYPYLADAQTAPDILGICDLVAEYIKKHCGPCSFAQINDEFVKRRGHSASSIYGVSYHDKVVRYSHRTLIHIDMLEWTTQKESALDAIAQQEYDCSQDLDRLCASASDLFERWEDDLPYIGRFAWTRTLVVELMRRSGNWLFLGNASDAFVPIKNYRNLRSLDDFLALYLDKYHSGAARLSDIEGELRELGIISQKLTQLMLGEAHSATVIVDGDVMLKSVNDRSI